MRTGSGDTTVRYQHRRLTRGPGDRPRLILSHPELQGLSRWMLATRDAHEPYGGHGFDRPEIFMERERDLRRLRRASYVPCLRRRRLSQLASANQPPSTERVCPLTKPLQSGSARKATALATSSGAAKRAIGTRPSMSASVWPPPAWSSSSISVFTQPGHTALTRTPRPPHSAARVRVSPIRPCLLAL